MSELRKDPVVGRWVIVAPERAERPMDPADPAEPAAGRFCPFCPGNEEATPEEILARREPGTSPDAPGWQVRVVPNKFPALDAEGEPARRNDGMHEWMAGVGAHEVIVEYPDHATALADRPVERVQGLLRVYRDRLLDLKRNGRLAHALVFKNKGSAAGATVEHPHSQLIATPVVPVSVQEELNGALEFSRDHGRCIYCAMLQGELESESRIVLDAPHFSVFAPFAGRFPFETCIFPKRHSGHFENISEQEIDELGVVLKTVLAKLKAAVDDPPYNYLVHSAPFGAGDCPHYHWHLEILPRLTQTAGFEWGSGFSINPVPPEEAARRLREAAGGELSTQSREEAKDTQRRRR